MADPVVHLTNGVPDSGTGNITTLGAVVTALGTPMQASGGSVTANAGTNLNTSALALETGGNLAAAASVLGVTTGAAVTTSATGTIQQYLRGIVSLLVSGITVATHAVTQSGSWVISAGSALIGIVKVGDGTSTVAVKAASTAPVAADPALVVAISPNSVNANGQATMANSAPVVLASNQSAIPVNATTVDPYSQYETVAASQTTQALGATGATGDYLAGVLVFPGTAGCGVVTIFDNSTQIGQFAGGGTTALPSLVPFMIPIGLFSVSGAWKITTGANVTAVGIGKFT